MRQRPKFRGIKVALRSAFIFKATVCRFIEAAMRLSTAAGSLEGLRG